MLVVSLLEVQRWFFLTVFQVVAVPRVVPVPGVLLVGPVRVCARPGPGRARPLERDLEGRLDLLL